MSTLDYILGKEVTVSASITDFIPLSLMGIGVNGTESQIKIPYRSALTFSKLRCIIGANTVTAASTLKLRDGGTNSNISVSITGSTTGEFIDNTNTKTISSGDQISLQLAAGAGGTSFRIECAAVTVDTADLRLGHAMGSSVSTASTTWFFAPSGFTSSFTTTEADAQVTFRGGGTLQNGWVNAQTNGRAQASTFKSRINGADGNIAVSITGSTSGIFEDTTHSDTVNAGDKVNWSLTTGTSTGNLTVLMGASFAPGAAKIYPLVTGNDGGAAFTTASTNYVWGAGFLTPIATESLTAIDLKATYSASYLFCNISANAATSGNTTVKLRKNSGNGNNNISITHGTTGYFEDSSSSDTFNSGDTLNYQVVAATGGSTTIKTLGVHLQYDYIPFTGSGSPTEGHDTSAGSGKETFTGSGAVTEQRDASAGSGGQAAGSGAPNEGHDSSAGSGKETFTGSVAVTEQRDTAAGSGKETFTGTGAPHEGHDTSSASGIALGGKGAAVEGRDSSSASGSSTTNGAPWDITVSAYENKSFDPSAQVAQLDSFVLKSDGTKLYVTDGTTIYQYSLSPAWDVSTASYDSKSFSPSSQISGGNLETMSFSSDGTKLYAADVNSGIVYQYTLSTAWDVSTASYASKSFDTSGQAVDVIDLFVKDDGTKFYIADDDSDVVYQYSITSGNINTASYSGKSFDTSGQVSTSWLFSIFFNTDDGSSFYAVDLSAGIAYEYALSTPWDISTASYGGKFYDFSSVAGRAICLRFRKYGVELYVGSPDSNTIYQYTLLRSDVTGSAAVTEQRDTSAGTGKETITGTGTPHEGHDTSSAAALETFAGAGAITERRDTSSGSGKETISGSATAMEGHDAAAGVGLETVATGSGAVTEQRDSSSGSGKETFAGTGAPTEQHDTAGGVGAAIGGSAAVTERRDASAASGSETFIGAGTPAEGRDTSAGSGKETFTGSGAVTEQRDTAAGSAKLTITGTASAVENADASSGAGSASSGFFGSGAPTEGRDTSSAAGLLTITGSGAAIEGHDASAGSGKETLSGAGTVTERLDTAAGAGGLITGSGATVERRDTASGSAALTIVSSGAAAEGRDVSAGSGKETLTGSGAAIEGRDTPAGTAILTVTGSGAVAGRPDTSSGSAEVVFIGVASVVERRDSSSGTGSLTIKGSGAAAEGADHAAGSALLTITGSGAVAGRPDSSSGSAEVVFIGVASAVERRDSSSGAGTLTIEGSGAAAEGTDHAAGSALLTITGSGAVTEGRDAAVGVGRTSIDIAGSGAVTEGRDNAAGAADLTIMASGAAAERRDAAAGVGWFITPDMIITGYRIDALEIDGYRVSQVEIDGTVNGERVLTGYESKR